MNPSFRENSKPFASIHAIRIALLRLSMEGYRVLRFSAVDVPRIEIDRPFESETAKPVDHGGKSFEVCRFGGCWLYWQVRS